MKMREIYWGIFYILHFKNTFLELITSWPSCKTSKNEGVIISTFKKLCHLRGYVPIPLLKNFENPRNFIMKSANFFCFVLQCTHREHVHNWNRRCGAKRPKRLVFVDLYKLEKKWYVGTYFNVCTRLQIDL